MIEPVPAETIPDQAQAILQVALQKIGLALAEANEDLASHGLLDYQTLAGSLYYNDPNVHCKLPAMSIALAPLDYEVREEKEFTEATISSEVSVYSSLQREVVGVHALKETNLVNSSNVTLGTCCGSGKAWKAIYLPGSGRITRCLSDSNC
jgi:hypothetical protein